MIVEDKKRLVVNGLKDKVFITDYQYINQQDITEDFYRCVVYYCSEEVEFVVDGIRFKATCERID